MTRTYKLYKARTNDFSKYNGREIEYIDYSPRYGHTILETYDVPVEITFISGYCSQSDYNVYDPRTREEYRITHQHTAEPWREGSWNYPDAETFNREYNRPGHVWKSGGPVPADVFEVCKILFRNPALINGR